MHPNLGAIEKAILCLLNLQYGRNTCWAANRLTGNDDIRECAMQDFLALAVSGNERFSMLHAYYAADWDAIVEEIREQIGE